MRGWVVAVGVAAVLGAVSGCGGDSGGFGVPAPSASERVGLTSSAFTDGGTIPRRYTCDGQDLSPPLAFSGVPAHTTGLALLVEDPDAPNGTFTHWLVWNIDPHTAQLAAGRTPAGATQGRNGFKKDTYGGPCPPKGKPHHYVFTVYAVDKRLALPSGATAEDLKRALNGHVLASGTLTGRYGR